ncbi:MAG: TolC family protein, partial [Bacteroidaceae bacterium]|nr:TolC family protein [Bacteroidaceae bacterium]
MKKLLIILLGVSISNGFAQAGAQEKQVLTLTLGEVIRMAQEQSPSAVSARLNRESAEWSYKFYKANYLPSVTLNSNPSYNRSINKITQPDGSYKYLEQNSLSADLSLSIQQNIALTGGTFSITSSLDRSDFFREGQEKETSYSTRPVYIGYSQSLFGLNSLKWDRRIQPIAYREACKQYNEAMELVASSACSYFFNLAAAQVNADIAAFNYASADTLYRYAQGRYNIGTITENEMLQLEINKLSGETDMMNARIEVEEQMQALRSFLGMQDDVEIRVTPSDSVPNFQVDMGEALQMAMENSPEPEMYERMKQQSLSNLAYAKGNAGLKADLYVQFGLSQTGNKLRESYRDPMNQYYASIGISLPILDWGRAKGQVRVARSNVDLVNTQAEQGM